MSHENKLNRTWHTCFIHAQASDCSLDLSSEQAKAKRYPYVKFHLISHLKKRQLRPARPRLHLRCARVASAPPLVSAESS